MGENVIYATLATDWIAGAIASVIGKSLTNPFLVVQTQDYPSPLTDRIQPKYNGFIDAIVGIPSRTGTFSSLFAGSVINVLHYFPSQILLFTFKPFAVKAAKQLGSLGPLVEGGIPALIKELLLYPVDTWHTLKSLDGASGNPMYSGYLDIIQRQGLVGAWQGIGAGVIGLMIYRTVSFMLYPFIFKNVTFVHPSAKDTPMLTFAKQFLLGATVAVIAGWVTLPFDTIRRVQMLSGDSMVTAVSTIVERRGWLGLWDGAVANTGRVLFGTAIALACNRGAVFIRSLVITK